MLQNYFKMFLPQEAGAFGKYIEKKPEEEATQKIEKIYILYIYREYLLCLQSNASDSLLQKCTNFVKPPLRFSRFEGSIIPERSIIPELVAFNFSSCQRFYSELIMVAKFCKMILDSLSY